MTSYSRVFYEPYDIDTGEAVGEPTSYASALRAARVAGADCSVRFHHADRLTGRVRNPLPDSARGFFDDEISRAIRTTEDVGPA